MLNDSANFNTLIKEGISYKRFPILQTVHTTGSWYMYMNMYMYMYVCYVLLLFKKTVHELIIFHLSLKSMLYSFCVTEVICAFTFYIALSLHTQIL